MKVFARVGFLSLLACLGSHAVIADSPISTASVNTEITSAATGETLLLRTQTGRYLALHFIPASGAANDSADDAEFVNAAVRNGARLAGVREIFVVEASRDRAAEWAKQNGTGVADLFADAGGALAAELLLKPAQATPLSVPATIVFDQNGSELFRQVGANRKDRPTFGAFEQRFTKATQAGAIKEYNLPKGQRLALDGYDTVAYFTEGKAVKGKSAFISTYRGVMYQFASDANRSLFAKDPENYLPTYGGWCATAMGAKGTKVEIDPTNFKVSGGRLFLFYKDFFSDALKDWNKHEAEWEPAADTNWKKLSGEDASGRVQERPR